MSDDVLVASDIVKRYGSFTAVNGVSIRVARNSIHTIIGPNGAGKTTFFHVLTGTVPITAGTIKLGGADVTHGKPYERVRLGMARSYQVTSLFPKLTVRENLRVAAQGMKARRALEFWSTRGLDDAHEDVIEDVLARLHLHGTQSLLAAELSHGQQRRLEVGMALAARPQLILLDEPTSGMGVDDITTMRDIIRTLKEDLTVLLIEHNMKIVMDISDVITVMANGQVLVEGPPEQVRADKMVREAYLGSAAEL